MKQEMSSGVIVYRQTQEGPKYLILYHGHDYWNFPKGKIEEKEKTIAAAFRETKEETGLGGKDLRLIRNFRIYEKFAFNKKGKQVFKTVVFYLAETKSKDVHISTREHQGYGWFLFREGFKILDKFKNSQKILRTANDHICKKGPRHRSANPQRKSASIPRSGQAGGK